MLQTRPTLRSTLALLAAIAAVCPPVYAAEHITLRNGSEFDCLRHEPTGNRIRIYLMPTGTSTHPTDEDVSYMEVAATSVLRVDLVPDPPPPAATSLAAPTAKPATSAQPTPNQIRQMLTKAGTLHNIDADLLASVVQAESNGNARALSRAGAQGLMQLMPGTASTLGVHNSFAPEENIGGGTAYLDQLLTRYHDDIRLAVAAYNAGPAAVDRYHGIPPYAETRAYVARVVREFNRRKRAANPNLLAAK